MADAAAAGAGGGGPAAAGLDPVWEYESSSEEDSNESFDMDMFADEENVMGADFKLSGVYGRIGMLFSGLFMTLEVGMVIIFAIL